jgi:hypothetical protein
LSIEHAKRPGKKSSRRPARLQKISTRSAATVVNPTRQVPVARLYGQDQGAKIEPGLVFGYGERQWNLFLPLEHRRSRGLLAIAGKGVFWSRLFNGAPGSGLPA